MRKDTLQAVEFVKWRASEVLVPRGTHVRFAFLAGAAHLNGRTGIIIGADLPSRRYNVAYVAQEGEPPAAAADRAVVLVNYDLLRSSESVREVKVRFRNVVV